MDKLEQRLKDYYKYHEEYRPEAISTEFLERLKALESSPEAAKRPRRRYVLPVAAAIALAVALGGWFVYQRAATPEPATETVAIQSGPAVETPLEPNKPAAKPQTGTKEAKPQKENVSEESVTLTNPPAGPMSGGNTPNGSDGGAASASNFRPHTLPGNNATVEPDAPLPVLPPEETPGKPNDDTSVKPNEETSAEPNGETPVKPSDETPAEPAVEPSTDPNDEKPDDPTPAEQDDPNPQEPSDPDPPEVTPPPDDPPYITMEKNGISAVYRANGDTGTLTLTLMSTGECVEIDVTDWVAQAHAIAQSAQEPEDPLGETPVQALSDPTYTGACFAFDKMIVYSLIFNKNGDVRIYLEVI